MRWSIWRSLRFPASTTGSRKGSPPTSSRSRAHKSAIFRRRQSGANWWMAFRQDCPRPEIAASTLPHTWGRTYWGGALFCLLADVEIHRRAHNRYGLQDALRGIVRAGGNMECDWPLARVLKAGDDVI